MALRSAGWSLLRTASRTRSAILATRTAKRGYVDMSFTFVAPSGILYNESNVKQVDVPSFSGSFGILPEHVPSLAVLKPGVVTVFEQSGDTKQFFVSSGSITINDDSSVQILAEEAHSLTDIDSSLAKQALSDAQNELISASTDEAKAEAQIAIEVAEELVKATQG